MKADARFRRSSKKLQYVYIVVDSIFPRIVDYLSVNKVYAGQGHSRREWSLFHQAER